MWPFKFTRWVSYTNRRVGQSRNQEKEAPFASTDPRDRALVAAMGGDPFGDRRLCALHRHAVLARQAGAILLRLAPERISELGQRPTDFGGARGDRRDHSGQRHR